MDQTNMRLSFDPLTWFWLVVLLVVVVVCLKQILALIALGALLMEFKATSAGQAHTRLSK